MNNILDLYEKDLSNKMDNIVISFKKKINKFRTNRIDIGIISNLKINYYGKNCLLSNISRILVENNSTLRISLFDKNKNIIKSVERKILSENIDLYPIIENNDLLIRVPPLTEEKKIKIIKLLKSELELGKIYIRNIRKIFKSKIKKNLKNKKLSIEEEKYFFKKLQKITDFNIKIINNIFLNKKKEII